MNNYQNHSGGCHGADMEWDRIGRMLGFTNHKHYRPADLKAAPSELKVQIDIDILSAALSLGRPTSEFPGKDMVRRNWFQADGADAIFAISRIVQPGGLDKGFVNKTGRQIVSGGTAWACEMAIQMKKPVHVFDMNRNGWYYWNEDSFCDEETPVLTEDNAGIGSRNLTPEAIGAITNVYLKTLDHEASTINRG